jgi:hypothetical protein
MRGASPVIFWHDKCAGSRFEYQKADQNKFKISHSIAFDLLRNPNLQMIRQTAKQ